MKLIKHMWIIVQTDEPGCIKAVHQIVVQVVQEECGGEFVKSTSMGDLVLVAKFPHRRIKTVEKAIAAALSTLPVKRTIVVGQNPYLLRPRTMALTMELYRRQDEVVGLG
jgi:hypothetical protein